MSPGQGGLLQNALVLLHGQDMQFAHLPSLGLWRKSKLGLHMVAGGGKRRYNTNLYYFIYRKMLFHFQFFTLLYLSNIYYEHMLR